MAFLRKCCGKLTLKKEFGTGFNTVAPEIQENAQKWVKTFEDAISAYGLPLDVKVNEHAIFIRPTPFFFESISTPHADPEYMKVVINSTYPPLANFIELDVKNETPRISTVKVQVIVNSPVYTIQQSIVVTWLFTEFIRRMGHDGLEVSAAHLSAIWAETTSYERGLYVPYAKTCSYDPFIIDQCIQTIDMAKASSHNLYAYFPMAAS